VRHLDGSLTSASARNHSLLESAGFIVAAGMALAGAPAGASAADTDTEMLGCEASERRTAVSSRSPDVGQASRGAVGYQGGG
jgi:hypothetical protein